MSVYKHFWYKRDGKRGLPNFGDELGNAILLKLGYKTEWAPAHEADLFTTGPILQQANKMAFKDGATVWGTGWAGDRFDYSEDVAKKAKKMNILAVRGQLTANHLNTKVPLGDPGLLASFFWPEKPKKFNIGLVKHYADNQPHELGQDIVIDAGSPADAVIPLISSCDFILSSSLHGCIVAESYGIPWMRIPFPQLGRPTKWVDFTTSLTRPLEEIQNELLTSLEEGLPL